MIIEVWTDGSANNHAGEGSPGGWGAVLRTADGKYYTEREGCVQHPEVKPTSPLMETHAAIQGLRAVKKPEKAEEVVLYTDSENVVRRCLARSWTKDLFFMDELHSEIRRIRKVTRFRVEHVPGHSGLEHNERAHELAKSQYEKNKDNAGVTEEEVDPKEEAFRIKMELDRRYKERLAREAEAILPTLDPKVWGEDAIEAVKLARDPSARFYPFTSDNPGIDEPCKVKVKGREGWLLAVRETFCHISFKDERQWNSRKRGDDKFEYGQMYMVPHEEVLPK